MDVDSFNAMLNEMGQAASWRRAYDCPCRDTHSGAAKPNCPSCHGKGVTWGASVSGNVGVSGQKVQQAWAKLGMYEDGDQVLTLPSDSPIYMMGAADRLTMLESSAPFSRVLVHTGSELLPFNVEHIDRVFWLDGNGVVVEGGVPVVGANGVPTWSAGAPPVGQQYSITGRQRPEYFVLREFPQDRSHFHGAYLPRRVVTRRMDLFGR